MSNRHRGRWLSAGLILVASLWWLRLNTSSHPTPSEPVAVATPPDSFTMTVKHSDDEWVVTRTNTDIGLTTHCPKSTNRKLPKSVKWKVVSPNLLFTDRDCANRGVWMTLYPESHQELIEAILMVIPSNDTTKESNDE